MTCRSDMTTYEKARGLIAECIRKAKSGDDPEQTAESCLRAMRDKRIVPHNLRASGELFKRFHAHCRYLGDVTGIGYRTLYNKALRHAEKMHEWPMKIIPRRIRLDTGDIVEVDVPIPESTTRATTSNLMAAYQVIVDEAATAGVTLPED